MDEKLKWLTNRYDPGRRDARQFYMGEMGAWVNYLKWLSDKTIGDPKPSEDCTVQQLKAQGMVGVYRRVCHEFTTVATIEPDSNAG